MPVVYRCSRCGCILYVFVFVGQDSYGVPTPTEVIERYGGVCPRCGKELHKPKLHDIVIVPSRFPGGVKRMLEEFEKQAESGDVIARRLLEKWLVHPFVQRALAAAHT